MSLDYYAGGSFGGARYVVNNLVIPSIGAVATTEVQVTLPGVKVGDSGFACPRDAKLTAGISILPIRVTAADTAQIGFVNSSAGAIDPADTFDFDVYIFKSTGAIAATI
jgi:hypothetical protein